MSGGLTQADRDFRETLDAFGEEARSCATLIYSELSLHHFAGSDPDVLNRVRLHPAFWNAITGGLQSGGFVALGRIYEDKERPASARTLLDMAERNMGLFQRAALEARKCSQGVSPADASEYAANAYEPRTGSFQKLRAQFEVYQTRFEADAAKIRHRVFAHAGTRSREEREQLFSGMMVRELEALTVFPLQLHDSLSGVYVNGFKPVLREAPTNVAEIAKTLPGIRTATWPHVHAVANVKAFTDQLKSDPIPEVRRF